MKKITKIIAICLCAIMIASAASICSFAANVTITGANATATEPILLNGSETGATITQVKLGTSTKYTNSSNEVLVNIVEAKPSDSLISFEAINSGNYIYNKNTMGKEAVKYNANNPGETVLAAMNMDPWFLSSEHNDYDGDGKSDNNTDIAVKQIGIQRSLLIIDGELWSTQQTLDESKLANPEGSTQFVNAQVSFAYTSSGKAFIGNPSIRITVKNDTQGTQVPAAGVNRLPAANSILIYNQRCGTESYAHSDAYEIYLECDSEARIKLDSSITGKVTHIFESGDKSTRPAIGPNTIVVSARGTDQIAKMTGKYAIGDSVTITPTVGKDSQNSANKTLWKDVQTAVSGFWAIMTNGAKDGTKDASTRYPAPIIGIKADGTVLMITVTTTVDSSRNAITQDKMYDLVKELGCVDAMMLDGGGSTQLVTLEGNDYTRRCSVSDGENSVRSVVNGLALVYHASANTTPVNQESKGINYLDALGLRDKTTYTPTPDGAAPTPPTPECEEHTDADGNLVCDVCGDVLPDPNAPVIPDVALEGSPSWSYFYAGTITSANGVTLEEVYGMRNPEYSSSWSSEEKAQKAIMAATVDGSGIQLSENNVLSVSGWAMANGSQKRILWSVDKQNWYEVENGSFSNATRAILTLVSTNGWVKTTSETNAMFNDVEANLDMFAGKTVNVHFAVTPGTDDKALHFLTIEGIVVPAHKVECTDHVDANGDEACDVCGEYVPAEVTTEEITEAPTEAPTEVPSETEAPTVAPEESSADETVAPEESSADETVVPEESSADETVAPEETSADETVAPEETSADETVAPEETSADETTVEDTTVEDTTVEDTTVEETTVEETTVEETTVEDTTVEETTVEDTTVEETTVADTTVEETTVADTTAEETTVSDTTAEETTVADTTAEETTVADTTVEETTVADTTVEDTTVADTTVADTTVVVEDTTAEETKPADTTAAETTPVEETTTQAPEKSGCGSSVALGAIAIISSIAVAFATKKKENE